MQSTLEKRRKENLERKFQEWLTGASAQAVRWTVLKPRKATSNLPRLTIEDDGSIFASGDQSKRDVYTVQLESGLKGITAIRLEALPDDRLPNRGPGRVYYEGPFGDFFLSEIHVTAERQADRDRGGFGEQSEGAESRGGRDRRRPADGLVDQRRARPRAVGRLPPRRSARNAGEINVELLFERYYAAGLGRFRISATTDPRPIDGRRFRPSSSRSCSWPRASGRPSRSTGCAAYYLSVAPELAKERDGDRKARAVSFRNDPTTLVMRERPPENPRPTSSAQPRRIPQADRACRARGAVDPAAAAESGHPRNRLALARWLVSRTNPLTGRVTMNRQWAAFFGRGLVRTVEDFGYQGERPSHPELLDWLACRWSSRAGRSKRCTG